jgi:hypothetical protein
VMRDALSLRLDRMLGDRDAEAVSESVNEVLLESSNGEWLVGSGCVSLSISACSSWFACSRDLTRASNSRSLVEVALLADRSSCSVA